jgi:hypothetical protein
MSTEVSMSGCTPTVLWWIAPPSGGACPKGTGTPRAAIVENRRVVMGLLESSCRRPRWSVPQSAASHPARSAVTWAFAPHRCPRQSIRFGAPALGDADDQTKLIAFTGRTP